MKLYCKKQEGKTILIILSCLPKWRYQCTNRWVLLSSNGDDISRMTPVIRDERNALCCSLHLR